MRVLDKLVIIKEQPLLKLINKFGTRKILLTGWQHIHYKINKFMLSNYNSLFQVILIKKNVVVEAKVFTNNVVLKNFLKRNTLKINELFSI